MWYTHRYSIRLSYVSPQFVITYKQAHNPATSNNVWASGWACVSSDVCTSVWANSRCRLTAELSWSESMRPSDRENRGIKHYHQKRLQCSLLRPHSFLQSSCWRVCSFVVSTWIVRVFESMHFSAPIMWRGRRRGAEDNKKSRDKNRKVRTPPVFHLFKSAFRLSILIHIFICQTAWEIHQVRITLKRRKSTYNCCFAITSPHRE